MITSPKSIQSANLFHSYMRGWRDGAGMKAIRKEFETHPDVSLKSAYEEGYSDGRDASSSASEYASRKYSYIPSILRAI